MKAVTFYRWSLAMPIGIPLLCGIIFLVPYLEAERWCSYHSHFRGLSDFGGSLMYLMGTTKGMASLAAFLLYTLFMGGIPYLATLAKFQRTLCDGNEQEVRRVMNILPLWMVPFQFVACCLFGVITGIENKQFWSGLACGPFLGLLVAPLVIVVGYAYVAMMLALLAILRYAGLVHGEELTSTGGYR